MKLSSYNGFLHDLAHKGIEAAAAHAAALGYCGVELLDFCYMGRVPLSAKFDAATVREVLAEHSLSVSCYSVVAQLYREGDGDAVLEDMYGQIDYAAAIGSPLLHHTLTLGLARTPDSPDYDSVLDAILPMAVKIVRRCAERGMKCIYEPQGLYFNGADALERFYLAVRERCAAEGLEDFVGICADLGNPIFVCEEPSVCTARLAGEVKHVHVKDYKRYPEKVQGTVGGLDAKGDYLAECEIGTGDIDLAASFAALKAVGYDGYVSIETLGDDESISRSMEYIKELMN